MSQHIYIKDIADDEHYYEATPKVIGMLYSFGIIPNAKIIYYCDVEDVDELKLRILALKRGGLNGWTKIIPETLVTLLEKFKENPKQSSINYDKIVNEFMLEMESTKRVTNFIIKAEEMAFKKLLRACNNNIRLAAKLAGVTRKTVYLKIGNKAAGARHATKRKRIQEKAES